MNCPRCQMPIDDPSAPTCPRCGCALQTPPEPRMPVTTGTAGDASTLPPGVPPPPMGPYPGYGAPPSGGFSGSGMYGPTVPPPPPYPLYPPYPPYPPYMPPPVYSSYAAPPYPYGAPAPGTVPLPVLPGLAPAAPPKQHYALIGLAVLLLVVVVAGSGTALYLVANGKHGANLTLPSVVAPTATRAENIYFQDPLTTNTNGWANDSHCFFKDGGYHVKNNYLCYAPVSSVGDCEVSVQVRLTSGGTDALAGLLVHLESTRDSHNNYYLFLIDGAGEWAFFKAADNQYRLVMPARFSSAINMGLNVTNTLDVRNDLNHYTLSINGTVVAQTDDSANPYGYVGVFAGTNTEAVFNNFALGTPQG